MYLVDSIKFSVANVVGDAEAARLRFHSESDAGGVTSRRHPSVAILDAQVFIVGEPIGDLNSVTWVMGSASHGNAHECPYLPRTVILNATRLQNPNCIVG